MLEDYPNLLHGRQDHGGQDVLPISWMPRAAADAVRMGSPADGGYVVSEGSVEATTHLLSMGLSDNWSFEEAFASKRQCRLTVFDPFVTGRFWLRTYISKVLTPGGVRELMPPRPYAVKYWRYRQFFDGTYRRHVRQEIGYEDPIVGTISLPSALKEVEGNSCFLKVDIEGAEYRILSDAVALQDRFVGVVIEFHDVDLHRTRIDEFIRDMSRHVLINVHPNNGGRTDPEGDPLTIEATWVRKDLFQPRSPGESLRALDALNAPNVPSLRDIKTSFG